ncbi:MAG: hypothetical protein A3F70_17705 [Acidobacteria bacterium RIFCSPLOWO2_12_FULL_67_14]|nr:MAG: hypothetical protein A3H29_07340 [Acidobacteria bacterium RIFCSPLOWO2_02_FULL_67_21]OFW35677.1 MAG: hypothetical protein A3F70_17705 [Acidobacteria bacterium RIFCSPLOWO2_12_FULL_67_14]
MHLEEAPQCLPNHIALVLEPAERHERAELRVQLLGNLRLDGLHPFMLLDDGNRGRATQESFGLARENRSTTRRDRRCAP